MYGGNWRGDGWRFPAGLTGRLASYPPREGGGRKVEMAMEADITADITVDALGLYCPMPIIMTAKEIKKIAVGQVLAVKSDDAGIKADLPAWCKTTGNELLELSEEGSVFTGFVRRAK